MLLENMSYTEVESYLRNNKHILVPIGSVEQHSPYGLIGTDFITAQEISRKSGDRMGICVAPTLPYGISPHHMEFKGTITLHPSTFMAVVSDIAISLSSHGFRHIIFINGHGGNIHPVFTVFQSLKAANFEGTLHLISWYDLPDVREHTRRVYGDSEGQHATPSEISVTKYLRPDRFEKKMRKKPKKKSNDEGSDFFWPSTAKDFKKRFPDGRVFSMPWMSNESHGEKIMEISVKALVIEIERIFADL